MVDPVRIAVPTLGLHIHAFRLAAARSASQSADGAGGQAAAIRVAAD